MKESQTLFTLTSADLRDKGMHLQLILCACAMLMAFASWANAASVTLEVPGKPDQSFNTIQAAIDAAPAGAVVSVAAGQYRENLTIKSPLTLRGAGWEKTTIGFFPNMEKHTLEKLVDELDAGARETSDPEQRRLNYHRTMERYYPPAIIVRDAGAVTLEDLKIAQAPEVDTLLARVMRSETFLGPENSVWITSSTVQMSNCAVVGAVNTGIVVGPASRANIDRCLVAGIYGDGIMFVGGDGEPATGSVTSSDIRSCYHYGISIGTRSKDVVVDNCRISATAWHGIRLDDCNPSIRNNRILNNCIAGIYASGATSSEITNNAIYECGSGMVFFYLNRDVVLRNTVADSTNTITIAGDGRPLIAQNLFVRNAGGVLQTSVGGENRAPIGSPLLLRANQIWQTGFTKNQVPWPRETEQVVPVFEDGKHLDLADTNTTFGARGFAPQESLFPVQPEELAILPPGRDMNSQLWTRPDAAWTSNSLLLEPPSAQQVASRKKASVPKESYEFAFRDLYETIGKSYPCFELKSIDWRAVGEELLPRVKSVKTDDEFGRLVMELVARLEDSHAEVMPGKIPLPRIEMPRWSPGCVCLLASGGEAAVYAVAPKSPAASAGIQPGMVIEKVGGEDAEAAIETTVNRLKKYFGYSSNRMLRYDAVRAMLNQEEQGSTVSLSLRLTDGSTSEVVLRATEQAGYLPRLPVPIAGIGDSTDVSWKKLDDEVGYIYVRRIRSGLEDKLDAAANELSGVRGMIVDVRGNSGGGFDGKTALLNFDLRTTDTGGRPRFTGPMAVLIDSRCISAGEGWASWFVANKRAMLFGEATAGASSRKMIYDMKNDLYKVRIPVKAYAGFLDRPIERRGLEPNVEVRPKSADLAMGRDTVLEAARAWLKKK